MKAAQFCVVAFPTLDNEAQFQRLRERFDPWPYRVRPYIPVVLPFTPANLDEIQSISDHVSTARRTLHPIAITVMNCIERGDFLFCTLEDGREGLLDLRRRIAGAEPLPLLENEPAYEPLLWLCRVPDPARRAEAVVEANRIGRTLGVVDSLSIIRITAEGELKQVALFPFGVGRVDFYERLTG